MRFKKLALKDRDLFNKFLSLRQHELASYSFENIYASSGLFDIFWQIIAGSLCIFFKDRTGCFLYLPPLGKSIEPQAIGQAFAVMDGFNENKEVSRIENIEEEDLSGYRDLGYLCRDKPGDYLCDRVDLAELKGKPFKSKRASVNYFLKNYTFKYRKFSAPDKNACLRLYSRWAAGRKARSADTLYQGMLVDSGKCIKALLDGYRRLALVGRVVEIDKKVKAFTFGYELNKDIFCILYEITELSVKGSAQFIFQRLSAELTGYKYINVMDDSGLENLKKVKLSYQPEKIIPAYIATRKNG